MPSNVQVFIQAVHDVFDKTDLAGQLRKDCWIGKNTTD